MKFNLNFKLITKFIGTIICIIALSMLPAMATAGIYKEYDVAYGFAISTTVLFMIGHLARCQTVKEHSNLKLRDGYFLIGASWIIASLIGAVPYLLCGFTDSICSAIFEGTAGFTTTGCSVFDLSTIPKGLLMWKAISHWLGGMGILIFAITILPALGLGGQKIFKAETPCLRLDELATKISYSAKMLYLTYIGLTFVEFILLVFKLPVFDAIVTAFGSMSTGGLFVPTSSLEILDSFYIEIIIVAFTLLASINFSLYPLISNGRFRDFFSNKELKTFFAIILVATVLVAGDLYLSGVYDNMGTALRYALIQVTSFSSTSGYAIADYTVWPTFCKAIMLILMFIGGCSSSTSGSLKVFRVMVGVKMVFRGIYRRIHPSSVVAIKLGGKPVSAEIVSQITTFIFTFLIIFLTGALVLSLQGCDMMTALSSSIAMLSNTGIAFGDIGASGNFSIYCAPLQLFMSCLMILGRLELFAVILLFVPSFWNSDKAVY